jgi:phosphate transport system substrate-binding protein
MKLSSSVKIAVAGAAAMVLAFAPAANALVLKAAGATSVAGLIDKCKAEYQSATGDSFDYPGGGSGAGKTAFQNGTVDFAFSDSVHATPIANEIHIPTVIWPVGILTNIGVGKQPLNLSRSTIAGIFAGQIKQWNDPAIVADNNKVINTPVYRMGKDGKPLKDKNGAPIVLRIKTTKILRSLPSEAITVIYRADNSGTSNNLTRALNKSAPTIFTKSPADSFAAAFPGDITSDPVHFRSASGSAGVAQLAKSTRFSITYAEIGFAASYGLQLTNVINAAGNSITPNSDSALAMAAQATMNSDGTVAFDYNTNDPAAYPFTATTYALASTSYGDATKAAEVKKTIAFVGFNCPALHPDLGFAVTTHTSAFGKKLDSQLAKLGA